MTILANSPAAYRDGADLLALLLRLPALAARPVWYDEAFSVLLAARPVGDILAGTAADTMPPGYYLALRLWMAAGQSIGFLRALNVILGVGLVGLTFVMARECFEARSAAWAALLAAVSPLFIYHAQELRMYSLLALSLGVYSYVAFRVFVAPRRQKSWGWWAGLIAVGALALYTHNLAAFSILAPNVYLVVRRAWRDSARLLLAQVGMAIFFLPWLVVVPGQVAKIQAVLDTAPGCTRDRPSGRRLPRRAAAAPVVDPGRSDGRSVGLLRDAVCRGAARPRPDGHRLLADACLRPSRVALARFVLHAAAVRPAVRSCSPCWLT